MKRNQSQTVQKSPTPTENSSWEHYAMGFIVLWFENINWNAGSQKSSNFFFFFFHKIKLQFELCTAIFRNIAIDFVDMHIPWNLNKNTS